MRRSSLKRKLLEAMLITSTSALVLTGLALTFFEFSSYKHNTVRNLSILSQTVAANSSGALVFGDPTTATELLSGLKSEPDIVAACLFDKSGKLFASWSPTPSQSFPDVPGPDGFRFVGSHLVIFQPVEQDNARLGTLFVKQDLRGLYRRLTIYAFVVLMVILASALVALMLSTFFQRRIARPVLDLTDITRAVSKSKDFSLRASVVASDEVGLLTDSFNNMLAELQDHQARVSAQQSALRESEERFRALGENIAQLAWMADANGWILWYNKRWYDYTGTTFEEMQGWGWEKVHHPDHLQRMLPTWKAALARGDSWEDVFPLRHKDGQYRWFLSRAFPIRDSQGNISRWFGTNTDITELRETQEELKKAQDELKIRAISLEATVAERTAKLRETVGELEAFSYSISHDMRAPLRAMTAYAEALTEDFSQQLPPQAVSFLSKITSAAVRMDQLITDVLSYSRVARGKQTLEPIRLESVITEIISHYPALQPPGADIQIQTPIPAVLGDQASLAQCLSNLLTNAVKFVAPGDKPRVRIWSELVPSADQSFGGQSSPPKPAAYARENKSQVLVAAMADDDGSPIPDLAPPLSNNSPSIPTANSASFDLPIEDGFLQLNPPSDYQPMGIGFVRLYLEDNGIGIAQQDLQRIFGIFERVNPQTAYEGTGIGLAIVKKAIERMGGQVGVESTPGKGSCFWLLLRKA